MYQFFVEPSQIPRADFPRLLLFLGGKSENNAHPHNRQHTRQISKQHHPEFFNALGEWRSVTATKE